MTIDRDTGNWSFETDVVIVGGGGCGLTAALAAAQGGVEVFVLEKQARPWPNTARSYGMIPAAGTRFQKAAGVEETPEDFAADIMNKNHQSGDYETTLHLCRAVPKLVEWLVDEVKCDLHFVDDFTYPGHSRHRMHAPPNRTGSELVADLQRAADANPDIEVIQDAPVVALIADENDAILGVVVQRANQQERVRCKKVLLACNGFGGNPDMVRQYMPEMADALYFGGDGNTGEGILWGMELGAEVAYMDAYQAHNSVATPHEVLISYALITEGGFQVNRDGQRFGTEMQGYSERALEVLAQPDGLAWNIYDERLHRLGMTFEDYRNALEAGAIIQADDIELLAERLGVNVASLSQTFQNFNAAARGEKPDEQGRTNFKPLAAPLYGVKITGALFHTQGGLKVDSNARVLKKDGTPIPNLYAGGGVAAGVSGHGAAGYLSGNGLLTALTYGLLAGQHVTQIIKSEA
jgi:fumarate reductase flavoprotein subunit